MQNTQYTNIAFISYKREDEKWAKWLQKKLEHYELPTEIRKQNPDLEFANNPRHVFKDTTDLSGGVLEKAIKEGLASSKYLIVICSPRAAKSPWVCKEVQDFIDSGHEEYIIPFIIDGEPYSKDIAKECFPEALKSLAGEKELLGININENGRDSAAVKVIARMFDVRFDSLWQRFQKEEKKKRKLIISGLIGGVLFLLGVIATIAWLLYQQWQTNQELDKRNVQIETQNKELHAKNEQIERQNKDLDAKSDSIQTANDSINKQKCELEKAYNDLKRSNWQTQTNYAKLSIEQANRLMEDDYYIEAREKMLSILPSSINNPDKPFIPESEETFRRSLDYNSLAFPRISSSIGANQLACNMFATLIASYSNDYIALWDRNTRKFKYQITHIKSIKSVNFSFLTSDNLIIVKEGKENDSIIIWNIDKQKELYKFELDGKYVNMGYLWDICSTRELLKGKQRINHYKINGELLTKIDLLSPPLKLAQKAYNKDNEGIIYFSTIDDSVFVYNLNRKVIEYKFYAGKCITSIDYCSSKNELVTNHKEYCSVLISVNGKMPNNTDSIKIWLNGRLEDSFNTPSTFAKISSDGNYIISRDYGSIKVIDRHTGNIAKQTRTRKIESLWFNMSLNKDDIIYIDENDYIRYWDIHDIYKDHYNNNSSNFFEPSANILSSLFYLPFSFNPVSNEFAVTDGDSIKFMNYNQERTNDPIWFITPKFISYSPDGTKLAISHNLATFVYDSKTHEDYATIAGWNQQFSGQVFSNSSKMIFVIRGNRVYIYKLLKSGYFPKANYILSHSSSFICAGFSKNERQMVTGSKDGYIRIWDIESQSCIDSIKGHGGYVNSVQYSPDNKYILSSSSDKTIKIWDKYTLYNIRTLYGHFDEIYNASYSFDGKYIVSVSRDYTARVWNTQTGIQIASYDSQGSSAFISPDNKYCMYLGNYNQYRLDPITPFQELIDEERKKRKKY